jgi:type IV pilus assembly protein PilC
MKKWIWEARARSGEVVKGVMDAENAEAVHQRLRAQNLNPLKVKKQPIRLKLPHLGKVVEYQDLLIFLRQFATMIDAGLPLVQALDILATQGTKPAFNAVLKDIKNTVEQGATFSDALRRHPKVFDDLFVNLVAAGEMGGILDSILNRLGIYIEKNVKLKRQVKSAMVYPSAVLAIAGVVLVVMLAYVIPTFEDMFKDFGGIEALPALTRFIINLSHSTIKALPLIIVTVTVGSAAFILSYRNKKGKRFWHWVLLNLPVLGPTMRKLAVARFTRTLGTLLSSGVPILEALSVVSKTAGNVVVESAINVATEKIMAGSTMAEPIAAAKIFPGMVVQMISVGEQTGSLDQMLNKIADFYEEEVDVAVAGLTAMLEPFMMVFIGGVCGFLLIAMYLPIFTMAGVLSGGQ